MIPRPKVIHVSSPGSHHVERNYQLWESCDLRGTNSKWGYIYRVGSYSIRKHSLKAYGKILKPCRKGNNMITFTFWNNSGKHLRTDRNEESKKVKWKYKPRKDINIILAGSYRNPTWINFNQAYSFGRPSTDLDLYFSSSMSSVMENFSFLIILVKLT